MKFTLLVLGAACICAAGFAQTQMATISGVLQDPNGNPVTGTDGVVQMRNTTTQAEFTVELSGKSEFTLARVTPSARSARALP